MHRQRPLYTITNQKTVHKHGGLKQAKEDFLALKPSHVKTMGVRIVHLSLS